MKAHFLSSAVPLKEGETYPAMCGQDVTDTRFLFEVDAQPETETFMFCGQCFEGLRMTFLTGEKRRRYLYAAISHKGKPSNAD